MRKERIRLQKNDDAGVNLEYQPTEFVQRKALSQLIYKRFEDVYLINKEQKDVVMDKFPVLSDFYAAIREFYKKMFSIDAARISNWLACLERLNIPEIQTYVNGVKKDIDAVTYGIKYEYNNGFAEGSVN